MCPQLPDLATTSKDLDKGLHALNRAQKFYFKVLSEILVISLAHVAHVQLYQLSSGLMNISTYIASYIALSITRAKVTRAIKLGQG